MDHKQHPRALESIARHRQRPGQTWDGVLALGTGKSFLSKLPGKPTLCASIGPSNMDKSKLAFVPPPPTRLTLDIPRGYCQPRLQVRSPSQMHTGSSTMRPRTASTVHPLALPAVQERAR